VKHQLEGRANINGLYNMISVTLESLIWC
jgi:hypothetical protein